MAAGVGEQSGSQKEEDSGDGGGVAIAPRQHEGGSQGEAGEQQHEGLEQALAGWCAISKSAHAATEISDAEKPMTRTWRR